ncbi:reverse transcriptase-like protein [Pseudomonas proteolytica]|uniref:reverse transcriptase-like protein n=1 Tax=Pseudomonas proteolytica TaxID=219574 RepID=UPI0030EE02B6
MTPDWNWFFSTLSQSTAAIVGIIGAFIIAKIFANQASFNEKNNRMKTLVVESRKILDKIDTIDFDWYNRETNTAAHSSADREIAKFKHEESSEVSDEMLLEIYEEANFSVFSERGPILDKLREKVNNVCHKNLERRLRKEAADRAREQSNSGQLTGLAQINALMRANTSLFDIDTRQTVLNVPGLSPPWIPLQKEWDLITVCHLEAKHHARVVSDFLESVKGNPESPPQITWSLLMVGLIFLAGVIYPLTFMPAVSLPTFIFPWAELSNAFLSVKGALLSLLAASFSFVFLMFTHTNISMKYAVEQIRELERLAVVKNYSAYFKYLAQRSAE